MLSKAQTQGPYHGIIGAGNYTIGTNERGMITPECIDQWKHFIFWLKNVFHEAVEFFLATIGGHDGGYGYQVKKHLGFAIGLETGGMSEESVAAFTTYVGPLFQIKKLGPAIFVSISSNLIGNVNEKSPESLRKLQREQEEFLRDILEKTQHKVFLVMHDPTLLTRKMLKLIISHRSKINAVIHGHNHSWLFRIITMLTYPPYLWLCFNVHVILADAPWGSFGVGKAFKVLEVAEDGSWKTRRYPL